MRLVLQGVLVQVLLCCVRDRVRLELICERVGRGIGPVVLGHPIAYSGR